MTRRPLDRNQQIELARITAQNARWVARSKTQRFGLTALAVLSLWVGIALVGWFIAAEVGASAVPIGIAAASALLFAILLIIRAVWPNQIAEWSVRSSVPRNDELDRPFMAFGDIRPDDFPSKIKKDDDNR